MKSDSTDAQGGGGSMSGENTGLYAPDFVEQFNLCPPRDMKTVSVAGTNATVLLAILAKQKEKSLGLYLECIENLDYPPDLISIYIRTNNNTDATAEILRKWVDRVGRKYRHIEFDDANVEQSVEQFRVHEWNDTRFKVLGQIRNASLKKALEWKCDYYFVCDVDIFITPNTLSELVSLRLPIVAPLLRNERAVAFDSNFFSAVDDNGYYKDSPAYLPVLTRVVRGVIEEPLVHHAYLVRSDVIPPLTYDDGSGRYEFVIFSHSARAAGVPQYVDNRQVYGYITSGDEYDPDLPGAAEMVRTIANNPDEKGVAKARRQIEKACGERKKADAKPNVLGKPEFGVIYNRAKWGPGSGIGSLAVNAPPYIKFIESFMKLNNVKSVVDFGCGDWQFSQYVNWGETHYTGVDVVKEVIAANRERHGRKNIQFVELESIDDVPRADLLLCKDVLQHVPNEMVRFYLSAFKRRFKYLLITNDDQPEQSINKDIPVSDFRPVRLDMPPFNEEATVVFCWDLAWTSFGTVAPRKLVSLLRGRG